MARKKASTFDANKAWILTGTVVFLAAAASVAALVGLPRAWRAITHRPEFTLRPGRIELDRERYPCIRHEEMLKSFLATDKQGILRRDVSLYEKNLARKVARAYADSPWVRQVVSVRKVFPNRIEVNLELREPHAIIQRGGDHFCVDRDGVVLDPTVYLLTRDRTAALTPVVAVPARGAIPVAGKRWDEEAVIEGIAMFDLYREKFARNVAVQQIEMQVENVGAEKPAVTAWLRLAAGPRVQWGRTPRSPISPAEVPTSQKAAALLALINKERATLGRFKSIDVRWNPPLCQQ